MKAANTDVKYQSTYVRGDPVDAPQSAIKTPEVEIKQVNSGDEINFMVKKQTQLDLAEQGDKTQNESKQEPDAAKQKEIKTQNKQKSVRNQGNKGPRADLVRKNQEQR